MFGHTDSTAEQEETCSSSSEGPESSYMQTPSGLHHNRRVTLKFYALFCKGLLFAQI